jgi:hypothetical protein
MAHPSLWTMELTANERRNRIYGEGGKIKLRIN